MGQKKNPMAMKHCPCTVTHGAMLLPVCHGLEEFLTAANSFCQWDEKVCCAEA